MEGGRNSDCGTCGSGNVPKSVLFVCVENSARSQMAEGFLRDMAPHIGVQSAGTVPGTAINPDAVKVMREAGIDIMRQFPKAITARMLDAAAAETAAATAAAEVPKGVVVINMGCMGDAACPALSSACDMDDWQIGDPKGGDIDQMRAIRDEIRQKVRRLVDELNGKCL